MMDTLLVKTILNVNTCSNARSVCQGCTGCLIRAICSQSDAVTDMRRYDVPNHGSIAVADCKLATYWPQDQLQLGVGASSDAALQGGSRTTAQLGGSVGASSIGSASDERRGLLLIMGSAKCCRCDHAAHVTFAVDMRSKGKGQRGSGGGGRAYVPHREVVPLLAAWARAGNDVTDVDEAVEHLRFAHPQYGRKQVRVVRQLVERALRDPDLNPAAPDTRLQVRASLYMHEPLLHASTTWCYRHHLDCRQLDIKYVIFVQDIEDRHLSSRSRRSAGSAGSSGSSSDGAGSSDDAEVDGAVDAQVDAEGGIDAAQLQHLYDRAAAPLSSAVPSSAG